MSRFVSATVTDLRQGRETWRVFVVLCTPAFIVAVAFGLQRLG